MIKLPVYIDAHPADAGASYIKDADAITICGGRTDHVQEIARLLNSQASNPKPGALDYHVDYLAELAGMSHLGDGTRKKVEASRRAILQQLNEQHPAVIALANLCGEIETMAGYRGPMYQEALAVIAANNDRVKKS